METAYRSNPGKIDGVARRRMAEARAVLGDPRSWTPEQKRQLFDMYKRNFKEIKIYEELLGRSIPPDGYLSYQVFQAGGVLPKGMNVKRITIQPGDTLDMIARKYGVKPEDLMRTNKITDRTQIQAGWTLKLPGVEMTLKPAKPEKQQKTELPPDGTSAVKNEVADTEIVEQEDQDEIAANDDDSNEMSDLEFRAAMFDNADADDEPVKTTPPVKPEKPAITPREEPRPLAIAYDVPLSHGRNSVADILGDKAANSNIPDAVRGLQRTLNKRGYSNPKQILPHLKEDGDFGPKTLARLDEELLRIDTRPVADDLGWMSAA